MAKAVEVQVLSWAHLIVCKWIHMSKGPEQKSIHIVTDNSFQADSAIVSWVLLHEQAQLAIIVRASEQREQWKKECRLAKEVNPTLVGYTFDTNLAQSYIQLSPVFHNGMTGALTAQRIQKDGVTTWSPQKRKTHFYPEFTDINFEFLID